MTGIGFDVPIAADNSRLKSAVEKARESLSRAQNVSFDTDLGGYAAHISSLPKLPQTDSHEVDINLNSVQWLFAQSSNASAMLVMGVPPFP